MSAGPGAIAPKLATYPLVALQAAFVAWWLSNPQMTLAAVFAGLCAVPRTAAVAMWYRRRGMIHTGTSARNWELLLIATGLPFSFAVGLIAVASLTLSDATWATVEFAVTLGYCCAFTASIGFRPNVATAFVVAAVAPLMIACLSAVTVSHLVLAVMIVLLVLVLRSNMVAISDAMVSRIVLQHEAHASARLDALTSLPNRRAFDEHLSALATKAEVFALILCDLDGFKAVNDTFGHEAGDMLLATIGSRLHQSLMPGEAAFRLGGDEFSIICQHGRAEFLAETTIAACRAPVFYLGNALRVSASVGVAVGADRSIQRAADLAVYAAKRDGRSCWRRAAPVKLVS